MIVAENGSDWALSADRYRSGSTATTVVVQGSDETLDAFAQRALDRLADLRVSGEGVTHAVLVGGGRLDAAALRVRSVLVRKLAAFLRAPGGLLRLESAGPERHSMAAIATTLSQITRGTSMRIEHAVSPGGA